MKKILIVRTDGIGDYILFRNFLEIIAKSETYNTYDIDLLCNDEWLELASFLDNTYINKFIPISINKLKINDWYKYVLLNEINEAYYDILINPIYSRTLLIDELIYSLNCPIKIGFDGDTTNISVDQKKHTDNFYTNLIPSNIEYLHEFERNKDFVCKLLSTNISIKSPSIDIKEQSFMKLPFENYILIFIGAKDKKRRWDIKNFLTLANHLYYSYKLPIILCGSIYEIMDAYTFEKQYKHNLINLVGMTSLIDMLSIIKKANFVIGHDTGFSHVAISLKKQTFVISNGNNFGRFMPYYNLQIDNNICIFPFSIEDNHLLHIKSYYNGSALDINLISPDKVFDIIKSNIDIQPTKLQKENFIFNNNQKSHKYVEFTKDLAGLYNQILEFNETYIIYGYGTLGKVIDKLIPQQIIAIVDQDYKNIKEKNIYSPLDIINFTYDKIIISVLGREEIIENYLVNTLKIKKERIIKLAL